MCIPATCLRTMLTTTFRGGRAGSADPAPRLNSEALASLTRRRLAWVVRDTPRRAVGCSIAPLPEGEAKLMEEVAYHEATGRVMPRARLRNRTNPRMEYRRAATRRHRA